MDKERPISPHLTIYKLQLTSGMSIFHRITGAFLYVSLIILSWLIFSILYYPDCTLALVQKLYSYWLVKNSIYLFLSFFTFSLFYHQFNGIRHLFWDAGKGLEVDKSYKTGKIVLILSFGLTVASLIYVYSNFSPPEIQNEVTEQSVPIGENEDEQ